MNLNTSNAQQAATNIAEDYVQAPAEPRVLSKSAKKGKTKRKSTSK
jgi:hypothetical protein